METGKAAAEYIDNFVNNMGHERDAFAFTVVHKTHRYLQQEIFRLFLKCIKGWAESYDKGRYDPRNEWTCKMSKEIRDKVFEGYL